MKQSDLYWLAGWLEGEGCFKMGKHSRQAKFKFYKTVYQSPGIEAVTTDEDIANRAATLMGANKIRLPARLNLRLKQVYAFGVYGDKALALMRQLRPYMGSRRGGKIDEIFKRASERPGKVQGERQGSSKLKLEQVVEIKKHGFPVVRGLQSSMARKYGVRQSVIWTILNGKSWKHVKV